MIKKTILIISFVITIYILLLIISRNPLITDDLSPLHSCSELIEKSDIIYVIPNYNYTSLEEFPQWCEEMRKINKTFALHGITHQYHEFLEPIDEDKLNKSVIVFENCFGYKPSLFRPPYNKISKENEELIKSYNMSIYKKTYILHPYCHCQPKSTLMKILNKLMLC